MRSVLAAARLIFDPDPPPPTVILQVWLQGCRPGCPWIGHMNYSDNAIACDKQPPHASAGCGVINVDTACPLIRDTIYPTRAALPPSAQAVIVAAGPRSGRTSTEPSRVRS